MLITCPPPLVGHYPTKRPWRTCSPIHSLRVHILSAPRHFFAASLDASLPLCILIHSSIKDTKLNKLGQCHGQQPLAHSSNCCQLGAVRPRFYSLSFANLRRFLWPYPAIASNQRDIVDLGVLSRSRRWLVACARDFNFTGCFLRSETFYIIPFHAARPPGWGRTTLLMVLSGSPQNGSTEFFYPRINLANLCAPASPIHWSLYRRPVLHERS